MFSVANKFYGVRIGLQDLRRANVASLFATFERWPDIRAGTIASLARWRRRCSLLSNPAVSWKAAFDFYLCATGETYQSTLHAASAGRSNRGVRVFQVVYKALESAELPLWRMYLTKRVRAKGWDDVALLRRLQRLPRSMPQGHRRLLFKTHLNAPITTHRLLSAGVVAACQVCYFCGRGEDSLAHTAQCTAVLEVFDTVASTRRLPVITNVRDELMLQTDLDAATVTGVVAFFASVWKVRASIRRGVRFGGHDELVAIVFQLLDCSWLAGCSPSRTRRDRRASRLRVPDAVPNAVIYRSDGASRGQGTAESSVAGWGAAVWDLDPEGRGIGPPVATSRGLLGSNVSNNVAEYTGLLECFRRAVRLDNLRIVFEVDSMLLARQLAPYDPWACRSASLLPLYASCAEIGAVLSARGVA